MGGSFFAKCRWGWPGCWAAAGLLLVACGQPSAQPLPVADFLANERNFAGNRYAIQAEVVVQLRQADRVGRLLVVRTPGEGAELLVFVPDKLDTSIYAGQRYEMAVRAKSDGLLEVETLRKL